MCFPVALVLFTTISVVLAAAPASNKAAPPTWKLSILPLLYFWSTGVAADPPGSSLKKMVKRASKDILTLEESEERWQFRIKRKEEVGS